MKKWIYSIFIYCLLVMLASVSFLFSPQPLPGIEYHGKYIHINKTIGFFLNYDAYDFIELAKHPENLLNKNEKRQSRPLYVLLGILVCQPVKLGLSMLGIDNVKSNMVDGIEKANDAQKEGVNIIPVYIGYIILNTLFLILCLLLFDYLLSRASISRFSIILFSFILLFNPIVKGFFWTAHQQILNLLTPLCCIYLLMKIGNQKEKVTLQQLCWTSLGSGALLLLYGNFLLLLPVIMLSTWLNSRFTNNKFPIWQLVYVFVFFLIPTLSWIFFLTCFGEGYYSHELSSYRQFVWIIDYMKAGILPFCIS